jgi:rhodanese-related sulfurtransferase
MTTTNTQLEAIAPMTLKQWLEEDLVTLVDVREPSEHAGEKIVGSHLVPLSRFEPAQIPHEDGKRVVLYCQTGNRSGQAARQLILAGYESAIHLDGGITAWKQAGQATQINKNAPISIMRQVQIIAGSLVLTGTLLGAFVSPWFLILSGFVGAGLTFAGLSGTCAMAMLLAKLPYNQRIS